MATASPKSPGIEALLTAITGRNRVECIEKGICATCGESALMFRDNLSRQEYTISGMCQGCQDKMWS